MNGSWHIYRRGERWQRARRDMRIVVATADFEAVGFSIPVAEFIKARDLPRHGALRRLGPDLLAADFDPDEALSRMRQRASAAIADVLLDQRVVAGIGNVYKSEVLFACRVNPFAAAGTLDDAALRALVETARKYLAANVTARLAPMTTYTGYRRTTRRDHPRERLWVYGRARLPCRRCGSPIEVRKQGLDARLTYWCPGCQPFPAGRCSSAASTIGVGTDAAAPCTGHSSGGIAPTGNRSS
jgi:endonuclease-8